MKCVLVSPQTQFLVVIRRRVKAKETEWAASGPIRKAGPRGEFGSGEQNHGRLFCSQERPGADQRGHVFTLRCPVSIWDYLHVGFVVERSKRGRDAAEMILWHILANLRGEDFITAVNAAPQQSATWTLISHRNKKLQHWSCGLKTWQIVLVLISDIIKGPPTHTYSKLDLLVHKTCLVNVHSIKIILRFPILCFFYIFEYKSDMA